MASSQTERAVQSDSILPPSNVVSSEGCAMAAPCLVRQLSVYSLTLNELQNAHFELSKSLGSMNMDEFLMNIWTVEESQAIAAAMGRSSNSEELDVNEIPQGIPRQTSISLPRSLRGKTLDDVWKDVIDNDKMTVKPDGEGSSQERQLTLEEVTLEDFLVKAGVVKKDGSGILSDITFGMPFAKDFTPMSSIGPNGRSKPDNVRFGVANMSAMKSEDEASTVLSLSNSKSPSNRSNLRLTQVQNLNQTPVVTEQSDWLCTTVFKSDISVSNSSSGVLHEHTTGQNGGHAFLPNGILVDELNAPMSGLGVGIANGSCPVTYSGSSFSRRTLSPQSPMEEGVSLCDPVVLHSSVPNGVERVMARGRKRSLEGSLEKVVERRQKRMIKNRESAARSRARKQVFFVSMILCSVYISCYLRMIITLYLFS
ncbi:hypothetical protein KP509_19G023900 [Ceratopteris richardii]|uniref:BZIP domain-containing protein n=1 Tax=Ceratopteris richardii TaxID=49495 RepID=A0A8T2SKR2_CERRI|nr:hypothetical protein KP509_19G023900 [Ceratopteris richardii]